MQRHFMPNGFETSAMHKTAMTAMFLIQRHGSPVPAAVSLGEQP